MQDALDDVTFLVATEDGQTKALRRYLEFFFDEDLDKDVGRHVMCAGARQRRQDQAKRQQAEEHPTPWPSQSDRARR